MLRRKRPMACVLAVTAIALAACPTALAGTSTSAGDQQYIDPLTATTPAPATTTTAPAATPAPAPTTASASAPAAAPAQTATSARTLPFTGMNLEACFAVGLGLLGTGIALRRIAARASH